MKRILLKRTGLPRFVVELASAASHDQADDSIYATWICTLGSVLISPKVWWLFLIVPGIAAFKLFGVAQPFLSMFLPGLFGPKTAPVPVEAGGPVPDAGEPGESRKQAKLRARMEKGDKRVQQVQRKK